MLQGFDKDGNFKGVQVSEDGAIYVKMIKGSDSEGGQEDEGKQQEAQRVLTESNETTLYAGVMDLNFEEQTIGVSKKITEISVANYSETANVTVSVGKNYYIIAPNLSVDLPINKEVGVVGFSATESNTKIQYVIKGIGDSSYSYKTKLYKGKTYKLTLKQHIDDESFIDENADNHILIQGESADNSVYSSIMTTMVNNNDDLQLYKYLCNSTITNIEEEYGSEDPETEEFIPWDLSSLELGHWYNFSDINIPPESLPIQVNENIQLILPINDDTVCVKISNGEEISIMSEDEQGEYYDISFASWLFDDVEEV